MRDDPNGRGGGVGGYKGDSTQGSLPVSVVCEEEEVLCYLLAFMRGWLWTLRVGCSSACNLE